MPSSTKAPAPTRASSGKFAGLYMSYDINEATLQKMKKIPRDSFFEWDSLYQYKDVVQISVETGRLHTICPHCEK